MALNFNEIKNIVKKYGLKPATQRELPLLTLSCISQGYTSLLRQALGFSYETIAAIGGEGKFYTMLNEEHIAKEMGVFIEKNYQKLDKLAFKKAKIIARGISSQMKEIKKLEIKNPRKCLQEIILFYPNYMLSIGIYNCFWRYIGNDVNKSKLSASIVETIANDRNKIAKLYPLIEQRIKELCKGIGKRSNFDGDILRYFTYEEISNFFKNNKSLDKKIIKKLKLRRKGYFYLYVESKKEKIILNKSIIDKIKEQFFIVKNTGIKEIKGFAAFKGNAIGEVFNLQNHNLADSKKFRDGNILVASMTHPKDIIFLKKSSAIVTDEGGILCHAAITAREMNKPCIIGTKNATKILKDGDVVEVDANKGVVKILKRSKK